MKNQGTKEGGSARGRAVRAAVGTGGLVRLGMLLACGVAALVPAPAHAADVITTRAPGGGIQPQIVVDGEGALHLLVFRGEASAGDLFYARALPGQASFSAPVRVNSQPGSAVATGTIRGGQMAVGKGGRVHVVWFGSRQTSGPGGAPMFYARLDDAGTAFEPQRNLMTSTSELDGGGTVVADTAGNVYAVWHAHGEGAPQGEAGRRVWLARSRDEGKTFAPETPISPETTGACACCQTNAFTAGGALYVLYRSAQQSVNRDMRLLASTDGGDSFRDALVDRWQINACPMSRASLAEGAGSTLAAWETRGQVYYGRFDPATLALKQRSAAPGPEGGRRHPALAVNKKGEVLLAWSEGTGWKRGGAVAWQVFDTDGRPVGPVGRAQGLAAWSMPAVFTHANGSFVVVY